MDYTKDDILSLAEGYKKGIVNWRTLEAAVDTLFSSQNSGKPIVSLSLPPSEAAIKDALLIGYVAGHSTQADIEENVLWENYKKYCLKPNKVPDDGGGNASRRVNPYDLGSVAEEMRRQ